MNPFYIFKRNILKQKTTMKKELIGLNTYLYTFPLNCSEAFKTAMKKMKRHGHVTEVFLNNEIGFELKLFKKNINNLINKKQ